MREGIHSDRPCTNFQRKISKENIRNNRLVGYSSCETTWFWLSESRPPSRYDVRTWTEVWSLCLRDVPEILHFITNLYLFHPRPWLFSLKILFAWLLEATWKRRTLHYGNFLWYDLLFPGRNNKLLFWVTTRSFRVAYLPLCEIIQTKGTDQCQYLSNYTPTLP